MQATCQDCDPSEVLSVRTDSCNVWQDPGHWQKQPIRRFDLLKYKATTMRPSFVGARERPCRCRMRALKTSMTQAVCTPALRRERTLYSVCGDRFCGRDPQRARSMDGRGYRESAPSRGVAKFSTTMPAPRRSSFVAPWQCLATSTPPSRRHPSTLAASRIRAALNRRFGTSQLMCPNGLRAL